jgi:predicted dehydrogenase
MAMINYGVVGVGGFGAVWVRSLKSLEERGIARLAAAAERNREGCAEQIAALEAEGRPVYDSLSAMLAHESARIDRVGIAAGVPAHEPLAVQAMEAGLSVHVEKPVTATVQEVDHLRQVEQRTGQRCSVGYQFIYSPTIQWLRQQLRSGKLGDVQEMRSIISWPRPASYYARNNWAGRVRAGDRWVLDGPATNATAHYLMNMLYLAMYAGKARDEIASVQAELYRAKPIESYDTSCIKVTMASGANLVNVTSHAVAESIEPTMTILCTGGEISWTAQDNAATIHYADGRVDQFADPDVAGNHARPFAQVARVATGEEAAPLCGLEEAGAQVLTINLAFESSAGIWDIPQTFVERRAAGDGSDLIVVSGMEDALRAVQASGRLFSELGLPWAHRTEPVLALDYAAFPQGQSLKQYLGLA